MRSQNRDSLMGIISLVFLLVVFILYFWKLFVFGFLPFQPPTGAAIKIDNFVFYNQTEQHSCHINIDSPTIIIRMDDVRAGSAQTKPLVDEILRRNLSITLGVIPEGIEKDAELQLYLLDNRNNTHIEIAQHGSMHDETDQNITEESLLEGNKKIQEYLGVKPVTYLPPYNNLSQESKEYISKHFRIISASDNTLKEGDVAELGSTVVNYDYTTHHYLNLTTLINKCQQGLDKANLCIVTIHPQEYGTVMKTQSPLSEPKFERFKQMLDGLQELNESFSTFNDLVYCTEDENSKTISVN